MLELFRAVFAPPRDLILLVVAGWVGLGLADQRAKQTAIGEQALDTLAGTLVLAFLIGGRILYAAEHFSAFASSPASILSLNASAFDAWAGAATALLATAVVMQRKGWPLWKTLDLLTPFLAALGIGLALVHLASGAAFGNETNLPWAIYLWGAKRHPTQLYELIAAIGILGLVWTYGNKDRLPGKIFLVWVASASASRLIIEGFRGDSTLVFGGLRLAQILAWAVLAAASIGMELLNGRKQREAIATPIGEMTAEPFDPTPAANKKRAAPRKNSAP